MAGEDQLFENLPEQREPRAEGRGAPRLRVPERNQVDMHVAALDDLVADDHPVRAVWAFATHLDLSPLRDAIKAREGVPGHPPAAPELLMARWLWGGVSMNPHSLADFRTAHLAFLERLLARGVAALVEAGLVSLDTLAQDGLRVRAWAGTASFRRRKRLEELHTAAQARVSRL